MLVDEYFAATLPRWEAIYQRRSLGATIYQRRMTAALELVDQLALPPGAAVLDVGCGPGLGSAALARRGFAVDAMDGLDAMVARTVARARGEGLRVRGRVGHMGALPFAAARFDLVFVIGVSEWLDALDAPLAEVARVLRPGGRLVMSADNGWALSCLINPLQHPLVVPLKRALGRALRRIWPRPRPPRTHAYSLSALDRALWRAGLTRTTCATLGFGPFSFFNQELLPDHLGHALDRRLGAIALLRSAGHVHLLAATKDQAARLRVNTA